MDDSTAGRDPFNRVYGGLRIELAQAGRRPGSQVRVDETARAFSISATPVREALARLAGERLVQGCRRQGYFVPRYSGAELIDLYQLSELYLLTAVRSGSGRSGSDASTVDAPGAGQDRHRLARRFLSLLVSSGSNFLLDAGALTLERLATARQAEISILQLDLELEREQLTEMLNDARAAAQAKAVRQYHRVRRAEAHRIATAFQVAGDGYIRDMV